MLNVLSNSKNMKSLLIISLFLIFGDNLSAQIKLPALIRDSMILQRDQKVNIWGYAGVNEKVKVIFNKKNYSTRADVNGLWKIQLPATKAGGPYTMEFIASNIIRLKEILFGDVWFCSGQSNMVHQLNIHDVTYARDIAEANHPDIRQFWVPTRTNLSGAQRDLPGGYWKPAVGADVRPFSAVAYFFAKKINEKYHVPVGIINASVGGTPIEAWMSEEGFNNFTEIKNVLLKNKDTAYINNLLNRPIQPAFRQYPATDAGIAGTVKWYDNAYIPKGWRDFNIPGYWEDQGVKDLNGVVWFRKEIDIPQTMVGKSARIFLGRIIDADELFINGLSVGKTAYQYPQRRYSIPANTLKAGKNVFVIRVTNTNGKGGFVPGKPYYIFNDTDTISLMGTWQYKVGAVFEPNKDVMASSPFSAQNQPASLYNAMVAGATNYNVRGFCWYQGESNASRAGEYEKLLPALINDWRSKWNNEALPFLYVQLPGFMDYSYLPTNSQWAILREAQLKTLRVPNTAMTVAIDLGEWNDIHPDNKKDVGERLALNAFKTSYSENIVSTGPIYQASKIEGNKIFVSFSETGSGLTTSDDEEPADFAIAGADKKFVWAKTKIEGNKVIVWSDEIKNPLYVRYAWADNPVNPNLVNKEGLPASPFRTDND
jgi:sialate O-acetylesterase